MIPFDSVPQTCPRCSESPASWLLAVEGTRYSYIGSSGEQGEQSMGGVSHDPSRQPDEQGVRLMCRDCCEYLRISTSLVEELSD